MTDDSEAHELYESTLHEHKQLRDSLATVETALSAATGKTGEIAELMAKLARQVEMHFRAEEAGGYYRSLIDMAPRIAGRAETLLNQHAALTQQVLGLLETSRAVAESGEPSEALNEAFQEFSKQLIKHEQEENALLQDIYTQDIGAQD